MFERLEKIIENAYVPMSDFRVASIVVDTKGESYEGVNVENPSLKDGLCAEQVAIATALSSGVKKKELIELHLLSDSKRMASPCFLCRQLLIENLSSNAKIFLYDHEGKTKELALADLCPYPFDEEDLK